MHVDDSYVKNVRIIRKLYVFLYFGNIMRQNLAFFVEECYNETMSFSDKTKNGKIQEGVFTNESDLRR